MAGPRADTQARATGDTAETGRDSRPPSRATRGNDRPGDASGRCVVDGNTTTGSGRPVDTRLCAGVSRRIYRDRAAVPIEDSMIKGLISAVIGSRHDRERRKIQPIVDEINEEYARLQTVSEDELRAQTEKLRGIIRERTSELESRVADLRERKRTAADPVEREKIDSELSGSDGRGGAEGELRREIAEVLDEILPEAFATVREACRRLLGTKVMVTGHELAWDMVPYDVQLMGGIELHLGKIAEMATGEGKTLVATLPLDLNALSGKGVHLVTVNSYLARRDSQWTGLVYHYLRLPA